PQVGERLVEGVVDLEIVERLCQEGRLLVPAQDLLLGVIERRRPVRWHRPIASGGGEARLALRAQHILHELLGQLRARRVLKIASDCTQRPPPPSGSTQPNPGFSPIRPATAYPPPPTMTSAEPLTSAFCTVVTSPTRADCFFIASSFCLMAGICSCF